MNNTDTPRYSNRFWLAALVLAWAVDFLFWEKEIGVSSFLWIFILLIGLFWLAWSEGVRPHVSSYGLAVIVLALSSMSMLRLEGFTRFINIAMSLYAITLLVTTLRNGNWRFYRLVDYLMPWLDLFVAGFTRPIKLSQTQTPETVSPDAGKTSSRSIIRQLAPYLRGVLLALPVVFILGGLLASADPVFSDYMEKFLKIFDIENLPEYLIRLIYILMLAFVFTGYYLHAILPVKEQKRPDTQKGWVTPFLGRIESNVVLISVDLLFAFFVALQFRYLFGGQANINTTGFTYSEYARRGFGELVFVAVLSLLLYQGLSAITRLNEPAQKRSFAALSITLMALVLVILASALQRLLLYENAYGFTGLRTYTHVFIYWLALLLLITITLELIQKRGTFALVLLLISYGFCLSLGVLNVDGFIARQNIQRARQGYELDFSYLTTLTHDAVPEMIEQYNAPDLPATAHEVIGAALACRAVSLYKQPAQPWQSFHPVEYNAVRLILQPKSPWLNIPVWQDQGRWMVTVNNETETCVHYAYEFD